MTQSAQTDWYIKRDQEAEGPFNPQELIQLAGTGRLTGDDEISAKSQGPWLKAETLEALELDWQVQPEGADPLPRCHVLALRDWVESEKVQPFWDILHLPSGEMYDVVDALCSALLAQNRLLEDKLAHRPAAPQAAAVPGTPEAMQLDADTAKREAAKWKRLYEDEIQRNESREQELVQDNESLRAWQRKAAERIKALERRHATLEEVNQLAGPDALSGDRDLGTAYEEMKLQITHLMESLQLKSRQLDEAREQLRELKLQLRGERKRAEESMDQVSDLHEDTLDQLNRLEEAHLHLTRSYRELNDRLIHLRNQQPESSSSPEPVKMASKPAPRKAQTAPPPPEKPGGPVKIKMT